jgi:GAF domain-containing protein/HAMP domain-containing protein
MNDNMTSGADTLLASPTSPPTVHADAHRGRLFRKYLLLILTLVTIALLASGGISLYFTYQEAKASLASLQHEKAVAAASRIEQYVQQIERQLAYAALPQLDAGDVELRRVEFLKLLRQAPEVTDVAQIDASGRERLAVSRLGMDSVGSAKDRSQEQAFREAKAGRPWYGPVYFKKETEPYMTMAVRAGANGAVTTADVNLKFIWDVVSRIHIGDKGKAYVVDDKGYLVADPDIGLVLRKTNLSALPHVQAAIAGASDDADAARVSTSLGGGRVLTSVAPIDALKWHVFVEQPVTEVYAKLNASIMRTALLLLAGLGLSALGALALARGMVRPIRTLEEGAQRIGAGDLDQRIEIRTGDELEALAGQFNRMSGALRESYAGLEQKVEARTRELEEALEQQTAISEILRIISSSPGNVGPMLHAVAERALSLCEAAEAGVFLVEGDVLRFATGVGTMSIPEENATFPLTRRLVVGRAALDRQTFHYPDVLPFIDAEYPDARVNQQRYGFRAILAVPLLREDRAIGAIGIWRREPRAFADTQIALIETFANQAAIAIENARLFEEVQARTRELQESLDFQTATSDVLNVISRSPANIEPVLDAIADTAQRLCRSEHVFIMRLKEGAYHVAVARNATPQQIAFLREHPFLPDRGSVTGRVALERRAVQVADVLADPEYTKSVDGHRGFRTTLGVPLLRAGDVIGVIVLTRSIVQPFARKQIDLVTTFADQAVIAMENARLFNETREALERQMAMSEILRVISRSPTDVQPVFDTIASAALRLCEATSALVFTFDGELIHLAANANLDPAYASMWREAFPRPPSRDTASTRAVLTASVVMIPDVLDDPDYRIGPTAAGTGFRSALAVPLVRDDKPIGVIGVGRSEPGAFAAHQISLLQTFADQAVIAIENVRLFNETKEALEQQTAVAEILRVISSSPTDVQPVLDAIADRAVRHCDASAASIYLLDGNALRHLASRGPSPDPVNHVDALPVDRTSISGRAFLDRRAIQVDDMQAEGTEYPLSCALARQFDHRTVLVIPLLREGQPFGTILLRRREVRPFDERERTLLQTFGDQAAIALENVRLFHEIDDKSRQLEIANKHKSEFLANMSH